MANYSITYSCGHAGVVNIQGKVKDRPWKESQERGKLCPECYQAELDTQRAAENAESAKVAAEQKLPELLGSPKAVAYGETCRIAVLKRINELRMKIENSPRPEAARHLEQLDLTVKHFIDKHRSASWWIDTSKMYEGEFFKMLDAARFEAEAANEKAASEATSKQPADDSHMIVRPEEPVTESPATIRVVESVVEAHLPEKRDDFREIVRRLGLEWGDGRWYRKLIARNGAPGDRAAELAHHLLAAGFIVKIADGEIRSKVIAANYEPEHTRWVNTVRDDHAEYPGWLYILWGKDDDLYAAARKVKGSKYLKPGVIVPPRHFAEVLDFAEMYDFRLLPPAQRAVEQAKKEFDSELVVRVSEPEKPASITVTGTPDKLEVPKDVTIDESLRDDN